MTVTSKIDFDTILLKIINLWDWSLKGVILSMIGKSSFVKNYIAHGAWPQHTSLHKKGVFHKGFFQ